MKLVIGNDHTAVEMKNEIKAYLESKGHEVINVGTDTTDRFHYPVAGYKAAKLVASGEVDGGVLICGTGVGISLAANKVKGVRACVCSEPYTAKLDYDHTDIASWLGEGYACGAVSFPRCITIPISSHSAPA